MADFLPRIDPFTVRVAALPAKGDVLIADRPLLGIATVMARGVPPAIDGLAWPGGPGAAISGGTTIVGTGPGAWLVLRDAAPPGWIDSLESELSGTASVADQSSAYAVLRLGGDGARRLIGRGAFVDFHADAFRAGSAAVTLIAHISATLWQCDDAPTYEVAIFRSNADSFWHWLESAASGFRAQLARSAASVAG